MGIIATGGAITYEDSGGANARPDTPYDGGYKVHTYTTVETTTLEVTIGGREVTYLVVAGGGGVGGGQTSVSYSAGGGGGEVAAGSLTLSAGSKTVTVANGGLSNYNNAQAGYTGGSSVFDSITAAGGLGGGSVAMGRGGASGDGHTGGTKNSTAAGGGGGDSANGSNAPSSTAGGAGGAGTSDSISGIATYYGGGGGGGAYLTTGANGNGGGYASYGGGGRAGDGSGGSGIVIVKYLYSSVAHVSTQGATAVSDTLCKCNGTITATGILVNVRGFCYKESSDGDPTIDDSTIYENNGNYMEGSYSLVLSELTAATTYKVRGYVIDDNSTEYGETITVTTLTEEDVAAVNITNNVARSIAPMLAQ